MEKASQSPGSIRSQEAWCLSPSPATLPHIRDERDWRQFHTLKDLAAAISIEAGELQELLLWTRPDEERDVLATSRQSIESELADVLIHALNFAAIAQVDLLTVINRKIDENERRYPAEAVRSSSKKAPRQ